MAGLLSDPVFREEARCALTRLPGRKATAALRTAFTSAPEEFKFALAEYYVIILNAVFSTLTFAAGMPLLVILCFFTLIALFACLKYMFIHFSKRPRFLKPAVVQLIVKLLPVSVVIHLVVAIVIYGFQFETTSVRQLIAESGDEGQPAAPLAGAPSKLYNAFFVKCLPLTIILFVFIGLMLLEVLVYKCLKPALKRYFKDTKAANLRYSENLRNLKYWSALNYDFRMLPKYTPLLYHAYASQLGFNADPMASQYPKLFGTGASGRPLSPHKFANHELNKLGTIREENEAEDATFDYIQTAESRKMNQNRALAANLVGILPKPGQDPRPAPHK